MPFKIRELVSKDDPSVRVIKLRCPSCRQKAVFEPFSGIRDLTCKTDQQRAFTFGQRKCPDTSCSAHIFFVSSGPQVKVSYPAEWIDFDKTDIPENIVKTFEEAIGCHANQFFVASAILVRKTLEELCRNQGATGKNLKDRIESLESKIVIPRELLDGLDDLRLLGNDAAHIESKYYNTIGAEEVETAIDFTKEVLKATFQYSSLLSRLRGLKKPTAP